jgi:hypothetical protein
MLDFVAGQFLQLLAKLLLALALSAAVLNWIVDLL